MYKAITENLAHGPETKNKEK